MAFRLAYDPSFEQRRRLLVTAPRGDNSAAAAAAVNLAAAFAEMGRDVLLVEADLRTPALARDLGSAVQGRPRWAAEGDDRTWPSDSRTNVDVPGSGAFTLIAGRRVDNVPRALTSAPVSRIVAEADRPGAVVIVLAPPVLSYADAVALIDRVEGVVVVCDPREVHRSDLERIREIIGAAGGSVLGTLLHPGQGRIERRSRKKSSRRRNGGGGRAPTVRTAGADPTVRNTPATPPKPWACAPSTPPQPAGESTHRDRQLRRRPGVAALTNILVLVAAARLSTVDGFARFSSVYLVFTVLLGISGAYTGQPLVLRRGRSDDVRGACRSAVVFTLLVAAALGALLAAGCLFVPGDTARALLMLGLVLPVVLGQDAMRYAFSTLQLPHLALAADVLRLVCVLGALTVQPHGAPAARLVAVWGLSALPAAAAVRRLAAPPGGRRRHCGCRSC